MRFRVRHITEIKYASIARLAQFNLRLKPSPWPGQIVRDYQLKVDPQPSKIDEQTGPYLCKNTRISLSDPITKLRIESSFLVDKAPLGQIDPNGSLRLDDLRKAASKSADLSVSGPSAYLFSSKVCRIEPEITRWAGDCCAVGRPILIIADAVMNAIFTQFTFDPKATQSDTPPIKAFKKKRGVCQDFAQIMICALRGQGIPAAYVSGYLRTIPPPGSKPIIGADATHAWVNVWCGEELGWIGFDPTNNAIADMDHIFTAMGRDYADVTPVDGVYLGPSGQTQKVSVDVALQP